MNEEKLFKKIKKDIVKHTKGIKFDNGTPYKSDISDIGNEIGFAISNIIYKKKIDIKKFNKENFIRDFIRGFQHGVSLNDGTH